MNRPQDFALLLACGLPVACTSTVDDGTSGEREDDVDEAIAACAPFADKASTCYAEEGGESGNPEVDYYLVFLGYCISYFGYSTEAACRTAMEDYYACIAGLSCDEINGEDVSSEDTGDGSGGESSAEMPDPCDAENTKMETECDLFSDE